MKNSHNNAELHTKNQTRFDILCKPNENFPNHSNNLPQTSNNGQKHSGSKFAASLPAVSQHHRDFAPEKNEPIDLISNAPVLKIPNDADIPDEYRFEIIRLRHRVEDLEMAICDRDDRNLCAIIALEDELTMWRRLMHDHIGETHDGIQRRIFRLEGTLDLLKTKGTRRR